MLKFGVRGCILAGIIVLVVLAGFFFDAGESTLSKSTREKTISSKRDAPKSAAKKASPATPPAETAFYDEDEHDDGDEDAGGNGGGGFRNMKAFDHDFDANVEEIGGGEKFVNADSEKQGILQSHNKLDIGQPKYNGIKLAYVTPWNNHGYDVVKWAAKKFTHISPVWFNVKVVPTEENAFACVIDGAHDIDRGWVRDILKNNSDIKFLPRFLFNGFTKPSLEQFLTSESLQRRCADVLVDFIKMNEFDGGVLEIWLQIMSMTQSTGAEFLLEIVELFSAKFHEESLFVVLPLTPPLDYKNEEIGVVSAGQLARLAKAVDLLNLMTYDYNENSARATPVAPLEWTLHNLHFVAEAGVPPAKLLMGVNWYGYRYDGRPDAILGRDFIEYLSEENSVLEYDVDAKEFRVKYRDGTAIAYYPTTLTLNQRLEVAHQLGLAGVAIWDVGQGLDHFTSVL